MIKLIAPKECPACGEKMFMDGARIARCLKSNEHNHRSCVVVYNIGNNLYPIGVNMYLDNWQFSFQEHITMVINNADPYGCVNLSPIQVETDFDKLQHKLQTILTFG